MIDLATLTGACMVALGDKIAGLMGNDDAWVGQVRAAADRAGEPVWHLPLPQEYRKQLESEVADLKNIGGSYGGALTAGLFLQEFVEGAPWVHLDIAGPARAGADDGHVLKGGTGFGVRTLVELARRFEPPVGEAATKPAAKKCEARRRSRPAPGPDDAVRPSRWPGAWLSGRKRARCRRRAPRAGRQCSSYSAITIGAASARHRRGTAGRAAP